ncbi:MAG: hypothetical protein MHM6MM_004826 [Cercozoa sp. M6MM]
MANLIVYMVTDTPTLMTSELDRFQFSEVTKMMFKACVYMPTIVLGPVGGMLFDSLGPRKLLAMCYLLCVLGQGMIALAAQNQWSSVAWFSGRLIYGCGSELIAMCFNSVVQLWFETRTETTFGLTFALAMTRFTKRGGQGLGMLLSLLKPASMALWIAFGAVLVGVVTTLPLFVLPILPSRLRRTTAMAKKKKLSFGMFMSAARLGGSFWLLAITTAIGYSTWYTFAYFAAYMFRVLMMDKQIPMFMFALMAAMCCPLVGILVDRFTKPHYVKARWLVFTGLAYVTTYLCFMLLLRPLQGFHTGVWLIGLLLLGPAYGLVSVFTWPGLAVLVPSELTGAATGIVVALKNLCASVVFPPAIVLLFLNSVGGQESAFIQRASQKNFSFETSLTHAEQEQAISGVRAGLGVLVTMGVIFAVCATLLWFAERRRKSSKPELECRRDSIALSMSQG